MGDVKAMWLLLSFRMLKRDMVVRCTNSSLKSSIESAKCSRKSMIDCCRKRYQYHHDSRIVNPSLWLKESNEADSSFLNLCSKTVVEIGNVSNKLQLAANKIENNKPSRSKSIDLQASRPPGVRLWATLRRKRENTRAQKISREWGKHCWTRSKTNRKDLSPDLVLWLRYNNTLYIVGWTDKENSNISRRSKSTWLTTTSTISSKTSLRQLSSSSLRTQSPTWFKNWRSLKVSRIIMSVKKIFIVGPPGFKVRELALEVAEYYKFTTVSVGDLLRKEVSKKVGKLNVNSALGEEI